MFDSATAEPHLYAFCRHPYVRCMTVLQNHVYVVLVNWNGSRETIECLESVLRSDYASFRVVVADNASSDDSMERLRSWASGTEPYVPPAGPLAHLVTPPVPKPVPMQVMSRREAEEGPEGRRIGEATRVVIVETGDNLGFAGGCNVGMRLALRQADCGYIWLLNNDTSIDPGAMSALVRRLQESPDAGQCGSRLVYYDEPAVIQAYGGVAYNRWLATAENIGGGRALDPALDIADVERRTDYVVGASICSPRRFVEDVGLLDESFFMYYEELDWAARSRGRYTMVYAHDSIVYHKEGRGMGSGHWSRRSERADFYQLRNRLRFTWRHERLALPTVALGMLGATVNRLRRRQPRRALLALRLLMDPRTYRRAGGGRMPA
jgi:GT2 family glycosyltransferase